MANIYLSSVYYNVQQISRGAKVLIFPSVLGTEGATDSISIIPRIGGVLPTEGDFVDGEPRPAECVGFDASDAPVFLCSYTGLLHHGLTFQSIETSADYGTMQRGTWIWLPPAIW